MKVIKDGQRGSLISYGDTQTVFYPQTEEGRQRGTSLYDVSFDMKYDGEESGVFYVSGYERVGSTDSNGFRRVRWECYQVHEEESEARVLELIYKHAFVQHIPMSELLGGLPGLSEVIVSFLGKNENRYYLFQVPDDIQNTVPNTHAPGQEILNWLIAAELRRLPDTLIKPGLLILIDTEE